MHLIVAMDPTHPRWEVLEARRRRSATLWKVVGGVVGASVLTAVIVASCLDHAVARRDLEEPGYVETTAATPPTHRGTAGPPATQELPSTHDSSSGIGRATISSGPTSLPMSVGDAAPVAGHASHANNDPNNR